MKKIIYLIIVVAFWLVLSVPAVFSAETITAHVFYGEGCPHCKKEIEFLKKLQSECPNLEIKTYEIYRNQENAQLMQKIGRSLDADVRGVPFLVIGDDYFIGYAEGITSAEIRKKVEEYLKEGCPDKVKEIINPEDNGIGKNMPDNSDSENISPEKTINLPFLGEIDAYKFSLPAITIIMGLLDGFNPCAMWTLLFLISLLLGMKDRKRMWILGTAFIVASAAVYFIFMSAWLNLILFLGFIGWVRIIIGILALGGGGYSLREFLVNKDSGCKVTNAESRRKVFQKLKDIVLKKSFGLALAGIIALAFMVNLVELICSAGLPAIYTQVLAINELPTWQYYAYMLLYIFFFMLDDLFVFFVAMVTLEMTGITTKYSRYSRLVGGLVMLVIGLLLIFKPEWLMFG